MSQRLARESASGFGNMLVNNPVQAGVTAQLFMFLIIMLNLFL